MKKKIYKADTTCGMCVSGAGTSYLKNMVLADGIPQKRNGWRALYNFRGFSYEPHRINGIYEYKGRDKVCLLVHAKDSLYECSYDLKEIAKIPCEQGVVIKDERSQGHMFGGALWLTGMGQTLIYDGESVKNLQNGPLCHVPVTATKIRDSKLCLPYENGEKANFLTNRRINTIRCSKNELLMHKFLLDAPVKLGTPFRLKASFRVRKSTDEENELTTDYVGFDEFGNEINTVVYVELYTDCVENGVEIISKKKPVDKYGREVDMGDNFTFIIYVCNGNELIISFDAAAHDATEDNIEVEFTAENDSACPLDGIETFSAVALKDGGIIASVSTGTGKVFLGGVKNEKFYFSEGGTISVGSDAEKITAILPTSQSSLAIYKESGFYILKLDKENGAELFPSPDILGCLGAFSATRLNNECLALGIDGIYGIKDSTSRSNISTEQSMKSAPIQGELDRIPIPSLEQGVACVHRGKYYLFLSDRAYAAQRTENTDDFVWWRLENCTARVALSANGMLYMGRENGDVAVFDSAYTDRRDYVLRERERDFLFRNGEATTVSFNYAIGVNEGDKISLEEHYALWSRCLLSCKTNKIHLPQTDCFENGFYIGPAVGDDVLLVDTEGYVVYEGKIKEFSPSTYTVYCAAFGLSRDTELLMYLKRNEKTEYVVKIQGGLNYLYLGKKPLTLYSTEVDCVYVRDEMEIECEFYTPIIDLGKGEKRTLLGICVTLSPDTRCSLEMGYDTGLSLFQKQLNVGSHMSFESIDFNDFTFNPKFNRTIKFSCLERNFDYIRLWLRSKKGERLGVDNISIIYI